MGLRRIEADDLIIIIFRLRLLADALQQQVRQMEKSQADQLDWPDEDLISLSEAWVEVGHAIGSMARTEPDVVPTERRPQLLAMRDGLKRIADIVDRQV